MGSLIRHSLALASKDVKVEFRRVYELLAIATFALSSVLISSFALRGAIEPGPEVVSSILWVVVLFSSILVMFTGFVREVDKGTIEGLRSLPVHPMGILLGKVIYGVFVLLIVVSVTALSSVVFLNLDAGLLPQLAVVLAMGALDLSMIGSAVSAIVMYSEGKTLLLSYLFFPVSVPVLVPGTQATVKILGGMGFIGALPEIRLLAAFLLAVSASSILLFPQIFSE